MHEAYRMVILQRFLDDLQHEMPSAMPAGQAAALPRASVCPVWKICRLLTWRQSVQCQPGAHDSEEDFSYAAGCLGHGTFGIVIKALDLRSDPPTEVHAISSELALGHALMWDCNIATRQVLSWLYGRMPYISCYAFPV